MKWVCMKDEEYRLLVKTAILYYKYDMNQPAISSKLGISRQKVGRLLKQARESGVVTITIHTDLAFPEECSTQIEQLFSLRHAIIIDVPIYDEDHIKEEIGKAAAAYLRRILQDGDGVSISWSSTVYQCARNLSNLPNTGLHFSQLNGSHVKVPYNFSAMNILNILGNSSADAQTFPLIAPMMVNSEEILESLMQDTSIQHALDATKESRIALFGIGSISEQSSLYQAGYLDTSLVEQLHRCGAVADVCGHFINSHGNICNEYAERRTIAISEADLKAKEYVIALAGSDKKCDAIYGALNGGWCNVLITDLRTAELLIAMKKAEN